MPVLFISHSSKDDSLVDVLASWLCAHGFNDIFVDHQSIVGGDSWSEALRAAASSCRVVICVVTPHWLATLECFNEFAAAWYMDKRTIPLFLLPPSVDLSEEAKARLARVRAEDQGIEISAIQRALLPASTSSERNNKILSNSALDRDRDTVKACRLVLGMRCRPGYKTCTWSRDSTRDLKVDPIAPRGRRRAFIVQSRLFP
jgi:hypothetical protein